MKRNIPVTILWCWNNILISQGTASRDVTGRPLLRYLLSTFPVTNRLYHPSRPVYDFVLNFSKDDLNRLISSWNLRTDDIKSSVQKAPPKTSSIRPETLDDRRDGTMPTLINSHGIDDLCATSSQAERA